MVPDAALPDAALPGASALLGADAAHVLAPALRPAGARLLSVTPTHVSYEAGRRLRVRFAAQIAWPGGRDTVETLGAVIDPSGLPEGLAIVAHPDGAQVGVWRYPYDPWLPGLPRVAGARQARRLLGDLGLDGSDVHVRPLVYRPGSRAVLRITTGALVVYVKVLPPALASRVVSTLEALAPVAPVPPILGVVDDLGIVVTAALPGVALTRPLAERRRLPAPARVLETLRRLGGAPPPHAGMSLSDTASAYAGTLAAILPERRAQIGAVVAAAAAHELPQDRTVHGDFYEAQVLVHDTSVSGLLDVDGARAGSAAEDPGTLIAHLVALARVHEHAAPFIERYRAQVEQAVSASVDRSSLRAVVATRLLGIAAMPFRRQESDWRSRAAAWLDLALAWAPRAGADKHVLTRPSSSPHEAVPSC